MEWSNVRQLIWCNVLDENGNGTVHTFAYVADGIRCRKNNIHYTCDGERILIEHNADTGRSITYLYGEKGVVGFSYRGSDYYYRKNLFGDVVAIYNTDGEEVATYEYDAWGKNLSCEDEETNEIKRINPIRYRSYYYDVETKFYYLNSRYYDPEIGRFLNADSSDYLGEGNALNNYNLFAYCENNPVMYSDPTGHAIETIFDVLSLGASLIEVAINPSDLWAWAGLVGDAVDLIPFVTGIGETTRGIKKISRAVDGFDNIVDTAKTARRSMSSSVGSYEILYKSGKNYVGKGSFDRAIHSAIAHSKPNRLNDFLGDTVTSIRWKATNNTTQAFLEEFALQTQRGVNNKSTYNLIWSPGKKLYNSMFD